MPSSRTLYSSQRIATVLTDKGLNAAVEGLAGRALLPVDVDCSLSERLPEPVEAAAYYVVAESLRTSRVTQKQHGRRSGSAAKTDARSSRSKTTASVASIPPPAPV